MSDQKIKLLRDAYVQGYFETPREISLVDLAEKHDFDRHEVTVALRDAMNDVCRERYE
jgi:predicted DNA binding protein